MVGYALAALMEDDVPWQRIVNAQGGRIRRGVGVAAGWYGCGNTALPNPSTIRLGITAGGRLVLAGPHPAIDSPDPGAAGFSGSLVVAEFPSLDAARTWADADPYVTAGVYAEVTVKPFNKVLP